MTPLFVYHERGEDDTQIELYIIYGTRFSGVYHKWGGEFYGGKFSEGNSSEGKSMAGNFMAGNS